MSTTAPVPRVPDRAAQGYGVAADAYERGRPGYAPEVVALVADRLGLAPGTRVLEIGAGTGKFTRALVATGADIVAVEPVAAMRERLAAAVPGIEVLDGTAELLPLPNASVDAVVVAQAFHWFDAVRALSEAHRVLRPGGRLGLAWNLRDLSVDWIRALGELVNDGASRPRELRDREWRTAVDRCALFTPLEEARVPSVAPTDPEAVLDWVRSLSGVATREPAEREALLARVADLLATHPATAGRDELEMAFETEVYWAERRSPEPGREGIVASVNTSPGGVPKRPVDRAWVGRLGVDGDGHVYKGHGGIDAAVCLLAQEAIERVRADGHELFPGAVGENVTLLGIDWGALRPGDRLAFDSGLELELTEFATPCQTIAHWFAGRRISRLGQKRHPEDARWYARVLTEGLLEPGDRVHHVAPAGQTGRSLQDRPG